MSVRPGSRRRGADAPVAATLWEDWTGGLAEPGGARQQGAGVGVLEARVPDEVGLARWPLVVRRLSVHVRMDAAHSRRTIFQWKTPREYGIELEVPVAALRRLREGS